MSRVTHLLIDRCDLSRNVPQDQGHGRYLDTLQPLATSVACRVWSRGVVMETNVNKEVAQQVKTYVQHIAYFEPDQDVRRDDIITVHTNEGVSVTPVRYRVTGRTPPSIQHHLRVTLEEIQINAS